MILPIKSAGLALALICLSERAIACELALALAIDVSGSVDRKEYRLQMDGLAEALRAPDVREALVGAQAAVLVVQWTGNGRQEISVPWRRLPDGAAVAVLADEVAAIPRPWSQYSTAIGEALHFTADAFRAAPTCTRRVIDLSSDGRSNEGMPLASSRAALLAEGFTINGLAIEGSEPELMAYFEREIIGGPGAFVISADGYADYPAKIRRKLFREAAERLAFVVE